MEGRSIVLCSVALHPLHIFFLSTNTGGHVLHCNHSRSPSITEINRTRYIKKEHHRIKGTRSLYCVRFFISLNLIIPRPARSHREAIIVSPAKNRKTKYLPTQEATEKKCSRNTEKNSKTRRLRDRKVRSSCLLLFPRFSTRGLLPTPTHTRRRPHI